MTQWERMMERREQRQGAVEMDGRLSVARKGARGGEGDSWLMSVLKLVYMDASCCGRDEVEWLPCRAVQHSRCKVVKVLCKVSCTLSSMGECFGGILFGMLPAVWYVMLAKSETDRASKARLCGSVWRMLVEAITFSFHEPHSTSTRKLSPKPMPSLVQFEGLRFFNL